MDNILFIREQIVVLFRELRQRGVYARTNMPRHRVYNRMCNTLPPKDIGKWLGYAWCQTKSDFLVARTNHDKITGMIVSFDGSERTRKIIRDTAESFGMRVITGGANSIIRIKMIPNRHFC